MEADKTSVPYMTKYLKYALEFEKYVYIWTQTMNSVNAKMRRLYSEREQLSQICTSASIALASRENYQNSKPSFFSKKKKSLDDSQRRQMIIIRERQSKAEAALKQLSAEEPLLRERQDEIFSALKVAKANLDAIYSENVLPKQYRNFTAVATMYEYLVTMRCDKIQGYGGIYSTYEMEQLALESLRQQMITNQRLKNIEDYQRCICQELQEANETLSRISGSLSQIEKTNAEIANNTAISAVANQQTASAANYLAWHTWAND